jgi:hypothetical protein
MTVICALAASLYVTAMAPSAYIIGVPRIDENSRPEDGYLSLPPSSARFGGIEWGCEGNDGYTYYLFEFDWQTGALLRYAGPTRPW